MSLRRHPDAAPAGASPEARSNCSDAISAEGVSLVGDPRGAIYWPQERLLTVADLHLEKGSSFAGRGILLPPYDTAATLAVLAQLVSRYQPRTIIALGDSFHDRAGAGRLAPPDRETLQSLQKGRDWIWVAGNHDPVPLPQLGGTFAAALAIGPLTFRHQPSAEQHGEIAGHLHPVARIGKHGRLIARRCFAADGSRIVMPALGAYAGGLNVRDCAFVELFGTLGFMVHVLGEHRLHAIAAQCCLPN